MSRFAPTHRVLSAVATTPILANSRDVEFHADRMAKHMRRVPRQLDRLGFTARQKTWTLEEVAELRRLWRIRVDLGPAKRAEAIAVMLGRRKGSVSSKVQALGIYHDGR